MVFLSIKRLILVCSLALLSHFCLESCLEIYVMVLFSFWLGFCYAIIAMTFLLQSMQGVQSKV